MNNLKVLLILIVITALIASFYYIHTGQNKKRNLIPRNLLFGNPTKFKPRISPDGNYLIYLASGDNNIINIWLKDLKNKNHADKQITFDTKRSIRSHFWAPNNKQALYLQDQNGDENWQLFGVDIETGKVTNYTPFKDIQVQIADVSYNKPDIIAILMNKDNPALHDLYYLNLKTGELVFGFKNTGSIVSWILDANLDLCAAVETGETTRVFACKNSQDGLTWKPIVEWTNEDEQVSQVLGCNSKGNILYLKDSRNYPTARLVKIDLEGNLIEIVAEDPVYDLDSIRINQTTGEIETVTFIRDKEETEAVTADMKDILQDLKKIRSSDTDTIYITSSDINNIYYTVGFDSDIEPLLFYLYNSKTKKAEFLFHSQPQLEKYKKLMAKMEPISFKSRDNLTINGYLTIPIKLKESYPLILVVHGGPWVRDSWRFNPEAQWLANRGYAVLQLNYRGSTGYGKDFVKASHKEWGRKMHYDLIDGVNWAIEHGITEPDTVAIYGGSYGGYAALVGATLTPDIFKCAIDIVGVSNLLTFLDSIPPYWQSFLLQLYKSVGHPINDLEMLKQRSPINHVDKIKIPILIAQGAHDPRVKQAESEQIVNALKEKKLSHKYLLFEDEGHGFANHENRLKFYQEAEKFLSDNLGGIFGK